MPGNARSLKLACQSTVLPLESPYTLEQTLDSDFLPD